MARQIATFVLGNTLLGVDILLVKEVYRQMNLSPIPDAPPHLAGLMNLRGKVVTVIDLNVCLNRPPAADIRACRLLIFKTREEIEDLGSLDGVAETDPGDDIVGVVIDQMDDVLTIEARDILPPPPNLTDVDEELIQGVIKKGNALVMLLDIGAVLDRVMRAASSSET